MYRLIHLTAVAMLAAQFLLLPIAWGDTIIQSSLKYSRKLRNQFLSQRYDG